MRWDCQVENRYVNPDTTIPQICDGFVKAAQTRTIGVVDEATVELARTSCVNDIQTSLDVDVSICVCRRSEFCPSITLTNNILFFRMAELLLPQCFKVV